MGIFDMSLDTDPTKVSDLMRNQEYNDLSTGSVMGGLSDLFGKTSNLLTKGFDNEQGDFSKFLWGYEDQGQRIPGSGMDILKLALGGIGAYQNQEKVDLYKKSLKNAQSNFLREFEAQKNITNAEFARREQAVKDAAGGQSTAYSDTFSTRIK